ncbi:MAG: nitroreductase family protein [Promethearchaeota archaeon]
MDIFRKRDFKEILLSRRSYKLQFKEKIPNREIIENCIDLARWAPNAHNKQFWRYIILEKNQEERITLIEKMNNKLRNDLTHDGKSKQFIENKINKTKTNFLGAPYLILLCMDTVELDKYPDSEREENEFVLGVQSISASATYFLLSLEEKGLAACWYCAPLFAKQIVKKTLTLPKTYIPMAFFTVGYAKKEIVAPKRKPIEDIIYNCKQ